MAGRHAACLAVTMALGYLFGYKLPIVPHVAKEPVKLYRDFEGQWFPDGVVVGVVQPGQRCFVFRCDAKLFPACNYKLKCGDLSGWTDQGYAFEPPVTEYVPF
ncbi:hypothetical protein AB4120_06145 [Cupriavidus sp. 2KB_3]|uniref:hypothetical protein n=1 Tax=Cupriavidus TaxID=106589 RepID=UPI0011EE973E|nr:hypothetical protein [Cupriavidus campinensis]